MLAVLCMPLGLIPKPAWVSLFSGGCGLFPDHPGTSAHAQVYVCKQPGYWRDFFPALH